MPPSSPAMDMVRQAPKVSCELQQEIQQFLYYEASLLDERKLDEWLGLLADDIRYFMPLRRTLPNREKAKEFSSAEDIAFYDDSKKSMTLRVKKYRTSSAWAEEPASRTRHFVSNTRITPSETDGEYKIVSAFLVYRNRAEDQTDLFAGERIDLLRRVRSDAGFELYGRTILLDQSMLMANNISFFF